MITILGRTDKPCFQCGAKEHVVKVKFNVGDQINYLGSAQINCTIGSQRVVRQARYPGESTMAANEGTAGCR